MLNSEKIIDDSMESLEALIDWDNDKEVIKLLNEKIYEITEDPCVSAFQCWKILGFVKDITIKRAYNSFSNRIPGKKRDVRGDVERSETYRVLFDIYNECIIGQSSPEIEEEDFRPFDPVDIKFTVRRNNIQLNSIEDFVAYMIETENWLKLERFCIEWNEPGIKKPLKFYSQDSISNMFDDLRCKTSYNKDNKFSILHPYHIEMLSKKAGYDVTTPHGATNLSLDIKEATGQNLGRNTIKRLVGVLPQTSKPHRATLNIIANYLGFPDWLVLCKCNDFKLIGSSGFRKKRPVIEMSSLTEGAEVEICWKPNRRIVIKHDWSGQYIVKESENCKLLPGDRLSMWELRLGAPFMADKVFRNDVPLGCYTAADGANITTFNILSGYMSD